MTSGKVLQLVAVGQTAPSLLKELEEPLLTQLGLAASISRTVLQAPNYAFNKDRNQYHCNAIMRRLLPVMENGHHFVLGVLDVDLFVPDSSFVFGEADRESKAAVMSIHRLQGTMDQTRRRAQVEAVHQAGHLMGLSFCEDSRCVMFQATTPGDCDRKGIALCNMCRNEFAKLNR